MSISQKLNEIREEIEGELRIIYRKLERLKELEEIEEKNRNFNQRRSQIRNINHLNVLEKQEKRRNIIFKSIIPLTNNLEKRSVIEILLHNNIEGELILINLEKLKDLLRKILELDCNEILEIPYDNKEKKYYKKDISNNWILQ